MLSNDSNLVGVAPLHLHNGVVTYDVHQTNFAFIYRAADFR